MGPDPILERFRVSWNQSAPVPAIQWHAVVGGQVEAGQQG